MNDPRALLTIAGTDPSGGAGLQVDLQVFRDYGFHGLSAVTAVVWQNTSQVRGFEPVASAHIGDQLDALFDDIPVAGIKVGMIGTAGALDAIAGHLSTIRSGIPVVVDPVFVSGTGSSSLRRGGLVEALRARLLPEIDWLTPNIPEAEALLGEEIRSAGQMAEAARALRRLGPEVVLLKGGHLPSEAQEGTIRDVLATAERTAELTPLERIEEDVRGTGCQLSSAIAAELADGAGAVQAAEGARRYLNDLLHTKARRIGVGRPIVVRAGDPP